MRAGTNRPARRRAPAGLPLFPECPPCAQASFPRLRYADRMQDSSAISRFRDNLQGEVDSAGLYRALSESEPDPHLAEVYRRLAAVEEVHAEYWRAQLQRVGARAGRLEIGWRARALAWLGRPFGPQFVLPAISTLEQRDVGLYDKQPEAVAGGPPHPERPPNPHRQRDAGAGPGGPPRGPPPRPRSPPPQ